MLRALHAICGTRFRTLLWVILISGAVVRLTLAFTTFSGGDLYFAKEVRGALLAHGLLAYDYLGQWGWNYPPGFFPWILAASWLGHHTPLAFTTVCRLPAIAADLVLAWLVQDYLGRRGFRHASRLAGAALVALSPLLIAVSAYQGQIDSLAILPAVVAFVVLERHRDAPNPRLPYLIGLLIGAGAAIKTPPLLMLLAILPSMRSLKEGAKLTASAIAVPLVALVPFALAGASLRQVFLYHGGAGEGGISLLVGPHMAPYAFGVAFGPPKGELHHMLAAYHASRFIFGGALLVVAAMLFRYRPAPLRAAVLIWLTVYAFGVTFFIQYLVWALPFLLMLGALRTVLALQIVLLAPLYVVYLAIHALGRHPGVFLALYTVPILLVWLFSTVALLLLARRWCSMRWRGRGAAASPQAA